MVADAVVRKLGGHGISADEYGKKYNFENLENLECFYFENYNIYF